MKRTLILFLFFYATPSITHAQSRYWQQQVNYNIDVTLNDADNTLEGYVKMDYFNNSPDTLYFIWIHLWPNAYKNDRTAFSDQVLENGSTAFYFSNNDKRGYINRLSFRVNTVNAKTEDHPQHQDIIKLILPVPLAPKSNCKIETPFHVKLPYNFSRGGHVEQAYQATQWYPKPAVYDQKGWHPIPYLDQGEFYSEFGNYKVQITLPKNYVVAATGDLQDQEEKDWLKNRKVFQREEKKIKKEPGKIPAKVILPVVASSAATKTLHYTQDNVHDFAWFADKTFSVKTDSLQLSSGRIITVYILYYSQDEAIWSGSIALTKQAIRTKSKWLGEYPYNVVTVVEDEREGGGMEYPTITFLSSGETEKNLDFVINHEVGHNWFYGILASNERDHPWMDEGMNTYYDNRYARQQYGSISIDIPTNLGFIKKRLPADIGQTLLQTLIKIKKDQPIETASEKFSEPNYNMVAYVKTGQWMEALEKALGTAMFDSCMREYYRRWSFKHPYPEDFKRLVDEVSGKNTDSIFSLLNKKGAIEKTTVKKDTRFVSFFSLKETDKHNYIGIAPAVGYNFYDKYMFGVILHNYSLPPSNFQFIAVPLYSSKAKQLNGIGRMSYSWYPGDNGQKAEVSLAGSTFTSDMDLDSANQISYIHFSKITPSFKFVFANKHHRSTITKFIQWKTFIFRDRHLENIRSKLSQTDSLTYDIGPRYLNQLQFVIENNRALYPYKANFQIDQSKDFVRLNFTSNYFFNYPKGGGLNLRFFAGKFFYTSPKTLNKQFELDNYLINMTGPKGNEDYTYADYFLGRNEYKGISSQQIMIRDGGFKIRTDVLSNKIGKTDNWLTAINLTTNIPKDINPLELMPIKIPLKAFVDIGTYADAWQKNAATGRFVYDAGLQLSLFKNVVNIYVPLLYSKVYKNYLLSYIVENIFLQKISFSIDIQNLSLRKMIPQISF